MSSRQNIHPDMQPSTAENKQAYYTTAYDD